MVDAEHPQLSLTKQCGLLSISRTSIYYTPQTSPRNKELMDRIDELFTEDPTRGTRRLKAALRKRFDLEQSTQPYGPNGLVCDLPKNQYLQTQYGSQKVSLPFAGNTYQPG